MTTTRTKEGRSSHAQQSAVESFELLRRRQAPVSPDELMVFWDSLPTVEASEILGDWRGFAFPTGHPADALLAKCRWYGKRFRALDDVQPMICRGDDGELFSDVVAGRGEASLWNVEFRGEVTASMVYDGQAVIDHFKRVDDNTLLGVMNGKATWVLPQGQHFWFGLERTSELVAVTGRADDSIRNEDR